MYIASSLWQWRFIHGVWLYAHIIPSVHTMCTLMWDFLYSICKIQSIESFFHKPLHSITKGALLTSCVTAAPLVMLDYELLDIKIHQDGIRRFMMHQQHFCVFRLCWIVKYSDVCPSMLIIYLSHNWYLCKLPPWPRKDTCEQEIQFCGFHVCTFTCLQACLEFCTQCQRKSRLHGASLLSAASLTGFSFSCF